MNNKLVIAAAGSGKTTEIVESALKINEKRVLITTFTDANRDEIYKKFYELNKCIPCNVTIQTWFSFLLEHGIRPFQGSTTEIKINGILLVNEKSGIRARPSNGHPIYWGEERNFDKHYFSPDYRVFTDKLSKLVVRCNGNSDGMVIKRISNLFPHIFIDEIQDMAGYDLDIIKAFLESKIVLTMVGDPRQVTYLTHHEQKYAKYKNGKIAEFIQEECRSLKCEIDKDSLKISYRNNFEICKFSSKLYPNLAPCCSAQSAITGHDGVFLVAKEDVEKYLEKYHPIQLRYTQTTPVNSNYEAINFGYSKGRTFDRVIIYPTRPILKWLDNHNSTLEERSRARFYVAITRAKYSVAIIVDDPTVHDIEGIQKTLSIV